ncbi:uncharacterized protein LOC125224827 [Leguminivora glycinivorella]|uniref:uncharacterized protein LOC125224827 n=1 Tax=Leguminivora glycinivorella TaxID=1035111 RepID=UPI00200DF90A|nr:uncharacterized protein LOC125224827 [Leguminivora glycinivorella]
MSNNQQIAQSSLEKDSKNNTPRKRNLEEDNDEPSTSDDNPLTPSKNKILVKLKRARLMIKVKDRVIKCLKEQNRRKAKKILSLMEVITRLKKKALTSDEKADEK